MSPTARAAGLLDIANGMTVRVRPSDVAFPNIDLTAPPLRPAARRVARLRHHRHLRRDGIGLTSSVLHDDTGPIGTVAQILTVRP